MTSFTPQGGGETPKALSSRVLVAAYWLFVVLMLATFTANLAAFLTVERMQDTVKSLEELNRQSKINYTVMRDSPYLEYFQVRTVTIVLIKVGQGHVLTILRTWPMLRRICTENGKR